MVPEGTSILVVDDDSVEQMSVARSCKKAGLSNPVFRASDGIEALGLLRAGNAKVPKPRVILLDINMPRMNGHEFLDDLRKDDRLSQETVFVLSTSDDPHDLQRAYGKNIAGYIVKHNLSAIHNSVGEFLRSYLETVVLPARRETSILPERPLDLP